MAIAPLQGKALLTLDHPSRSIEAYEGSVRSGKTITTLVLWIRYILTAPPGDLAMVGRTERTVINNLLRPMQQMIGAKRMRIVRGDGYAMICGRRVNFYGADNEQAVTKIQGATLAGAYVDEASTLPEAFFNMLYSRLSVKGAKLFLTSNPDSPSHWLLERWLSRARLWINGDGHIIHSDDPDALDLHRYTFLLDDNPNLDPEYVERTKRSYSGLFHKRYILAQWVAAEGAVYPQWDPVRHVIPETALPADLAPVAFHMDHGTTNPTRGHLLGIGTHPTGNGKALYVYDEWAPNNTNRDDAWQVQDQIQWRAGRPTRYNIVDPAAKSMRAAMMTAKIPTTPAHNAVVPGIQTVSALLSADRLFVVDKCKTLIREMPGYSWDPAATKRGEDKPLKRDDHSCDSLRYGVHTTRQFWMKQIPMVTPGRGDFEGSA